MRYKFVTFFVLLKLFIYFDLPSDPSQQPFTGSVIGNTSDPKAATTAQFAAFWGELALRFKNNPKVIFGLNNEPHDMVRFMIIGLETVHQPSSLHLHSPRN